MDASRLENLLRYSQNKRQVPEATRQLVKGLSGIEVMGVTSHRKKEWRLNR